MQQSTTQTQRLTKAPLPCHYRVADHREAWARILPGLEKLHAMYPDQDWSITDIRKMLDRDVALLLTDDADETAFAIVVLDDYPYADGERELFVYLLWHKGGDVIARYQAHLEAFALMSGANHIRFFTRRPAFLRVANRVGYRLRGIEFVKELHHGRR
jgi:hypothetical protein